MMNELKTMLDQLAETGNLDPKTLELLEQATHDPTKLGEALELLKPLADGLQETLIIEDYYTEGDGKDYELKWPLGGNNPLSSSGISFDRLDRKTQFFTLFSEWQRRETEGMMALTQGDVESAERIFRECLLRADQIQVGELRARSFEGLMRIAEKTQGQDRVLHWLEMAREARARAS